jgi:hypothetical protein
LLSTVTLNFRPKTARAESYMRGGEVKQRIGGRAAGEDRDVSREHKILHIEQDTIELPQVDQVRMIEDAGLVFGRSKWKAAEGVVDRPNKGVSDETKGKARDH